MLVGRNIFLAHQEKAEKVLGSKISPASKLTFLAKAGKVDPYLQLFISMYQLFYNGVLAKYHI